MKNKTIVFYAPFGKGTPGEKIGGAESGCLKTLDCYQKNGFQVVLVHKPTTNSGIISYLFKLFFVPFVILKHLLNKPGSVLHVAGFYLKLVSYEYLLISLAKLAGHKTIYEIRNGGMIEAYVARGPMYKFFMKCIIIKSSLVLCQGKEYVDFILNNWGINTFYYPNYIKDIYLAKNKRNREEYGTLNLIYFGRVAESKNVRIILDIFEHVFNKYPYARLSIIGGYSKLYKEQLDTHLSTLKLDSKSIKFYGRQDFSFIHSILNSSHYFLFPSSELREGHSNSLTEAMGCGVVPVVSNVGFNASISGEEFLVLNNFDARSYAEKIIIIEESRKWSYFSEKSRLHISSNYTEELISSRLINVVNNLITA